MKLINYCSNDELRDYYNPGLTVASGTDDSIYGLAITSASRAIDYATGRQFGLADTLETRYYTPIRSMRHLESALLLVPAIEYGMHYVDSGRYSVAIDDLMTTSGMIVMSDYSNDESYSFAVTDYKMKPANNVLIGKAWTHISFKWGERVTRYPDSVAVTALWGWTAVPDTIKEACLIQASRFLKRRYAPFGIVEASVEGGTSTRLLAKLDPDVYTMIHPYIRSWGSVN